MVESPEQTIKEGTGNKDAARGTQIQIFSLLYGGTSKKRELFLAGITTEKEAVCRYQREFQNTMQIIIREPAAEFAYYPLS